MVEGGCYGRFTAQGDGQIRSYGVEGEVIGSYNFIKIRARASVRLETKKPTLEFK